MKYPAYILSVLVACTIFFLCLVQIPEETSPDFYIPHVDKMVHLLMFFGMAGILFVEYFKKINRYTWKQMGLFFFGKEKAPFLSIPACTVFLIAILSAFYGGTIEIIQHYFSDVRTGDWDDFLADALGNIGSTFIASYNLL